MWKAIELKYHSYDYQTFFGADRDDIYTTEVNLKTKEEAIKSIKAHRKSAALDRKRFLEVPKKDIIKTEYLKP